jgi:glycyl-tRNA synthetase (class II)
MTMQSSEEKKISKDPDLLKKRQKKLYDANYATRPGSAQFRVSMERWEEIFGVKNRTRLTLGGKEV